MRGLPERQRSESVLAVLDIYRQPAQAVAGSLVPGKHFQAAVDRLGRRIPHVTAELITKYLSDMRCRRWRSNGKGRCSPSHR